LVVVGVGVVNGSDVVFGNLRALLDEHLLDPVVKISEIDRAKLLSAELVDSLLSIVVILNIHLI